MDFFGEQERALKKSGWLLTLFLLGVAGVVFAVYFPLAWILSPYLEVFKDNARAAEAISSETYDFAAHNVRGLINFELFLPVALVVVGVITIMSLWKRHELASGGAAGVAETLGAREVLPGTTDFREVVLRNVVEEMALASGSPAPRIFILPGESSINAFAASTSPRDAVVGVTRGALEKLSREELQGVIAHEMSHIHYGDSKLNVKMISLVFGLLGLTVLGRILLELAWRSGGNRRDGAAFALVLFITGLVLIVVGGLSVFFGRILQAAINRQREFLADAAAVQYTRNPNGIAGALKKIGGYTSVSHLGGHANDTAHMMFADPLHHWFGSLLASHPPLALRIKKIDPSFSGEIKPENFSAPISIADAIHAGFAPGKQQNTTQNALSSQHFAQDTSLSTQTTPAGPVDDTNSATTKPHPYYPVAIRQGFDEKIIDAMSHPASAAAFCHLILLSNEPKLRDHQLSHIQQHAAPNIIAEIQRLHATIESVPREKRLWLVDLAIPALRTMSVEQTQQFVRTIHEVIMMDGIRDLYEFALEQIIRRHLLAHHRLLPPPLVRYRPPRAPLSVHTGLLLSAVAHADAPDTDSAKKAFDIGASQLDYLDRAPVWHELDQCTWPALQAAIDAYCQAAPILKKNLIYSATTAALSDNKTSLQQWELMRAIADAIDSPLPPRILEN
jgi:Zn-dependent protease with chaperone function